MKKIVIIMAILSGFAVYLPADILNIGINVDYTTLAMKDINNAISTATISGASVTKFGNGLAGSVDLGFPLIPFLLVGPRAGIVYAFPAEVKAGDSTLGANITYNAILVPLELGAQLKIGAPGFPVSLTGGAFGGYGFAFFNESENISILGINVGTNVPYGGGGFVEDIVAALNMDILPFLKFNLNAGYRIANITKLTASSDVSSNGTTIVHKGDYLKLNGTTNTAADFSGLNAGIGLSFVF